MKSTWPLMLLLMASTNITTVTTTTSEQNSTTARLPNEIPAPFQPTTAAPPPPTSTQNESSASSLEMSPMGEDEHSLYDDFDFIWVNVISPFDANASESDIDFWRQTTIAFNDYCFNLCNRSAYPPPLEFYVSRTCLCHCDRACLFYGDCCPDVYAAMGYRPPSAIDEDIVQCSPTVFGSPELQSRQFAMVTSCPDENDVEGLLSETGLEEFRQLSAKCASWSLSHWNYTRPATNGEFVTYKNQYCAQCFGNTFSPALGASHSKLHPLVFSVLYDVSNLTLWDVAVSIADPATVMHLTSSLELFQAGTSDANSTVSYYWLTELNDRRRDCSSDEARVSRCNVTGLWEHYDVNVERACLLLTTRTAMMYTYKNPFCYLCNTYKTWTELLKEMGGGMTGDGVDLPLLILLDFDDDDDDDDDKRNEEDLMGQNHNCFFDQFYDTKKESCRNVTCPLGKRLVKDTGNVPSDVIGCRSWPPVTNLYGYSLCFLDNQPTGTLQELLYNKFFNDELQVAWAIDSFFYNLRDPLKYNSGATYGFHTEEDLERNRTTYLYFFQLFSSWLQNRDEVDTALTNSLTDFHEFFRGLFNSSTLQLAPSCDPDTFKTLITVGSELVTGPVVEAYFTASQSENAVYLPLSQILNCPSVQLQSAEFRYEKKSNELVVLEVNNGTQKEVMNVTLPSYHIDNIGSASVCLSKYQTRKSQTDQEEGKEESAMGVVLFWMSLLSLVVSIVFLFVSFLVYCLLPSLRTVAGINNLILIISLFWAQLLILIGTYVRLVDWLCQVVGVATHFFWLLVIFAQNVCTFHMFYTLSFPLQSHVAMASPRKMTRRYVLYVVSMATAFVVAVLVWQFVAEGHSGYGGKSCFIKIAVVRISLFAAPLGVTVVSNIAMFVVTVVRLGSLQHVESTRSSRVSLILYTKLSVFTGLTWLFGFLASLLSSVPLTFVYVVAQGCQGLFIFLAFLANKRVMGMLWEKSSSRTKTSSVTAHRASAGPTRGTHISTACDSTQSSPQQQKAQPDSEIKDNGVAHDDVEIAITGKQV